MQPFSLPDSEYQSASNPYFVVADTSWILSRQNLQWDLCMILRKIRRIIPSQAPSPWASVLNISKSVGRRPAYVYLTKQCSTKETTWGASKSAWKKWPALLHRRQPDRNALVSQIFAQFDDEMSFLIACFWDSSCEFSRHERPYQWDANE